MKTDRGYSGEHSSVPMRALEVGRKARTYALRLLEIRDRTTDELAGKMRARGHTEDVIREVLAELESLGYLDDVKYARHFADTRATCQRFGPVRIRIELEKRGIPRELAENAASRAFERAGESDTALALAREWIARREAPDQSVARRRLYEFLARRGFSSDVVERVLREVLGGD